MKKRHHFVWQYYLSAWRDSKVVSCWQNGEVFATATKNLAVEGLFHRLQTLTATDIKIIQHQLATMPPDLAQVNEGWLSLFLDAHKLKQLSKSITEADGKAARSLVDAADEFEEELHTRNEQSAQKQLELLRKGTVPELWTHDGMTFIAYLTTQYLRTKAMQESIAAATAGCALRMSGAWQVLRHIFATSMAAGIIQRRQTLVPVLLHAPAGGRFITGDQPVVNTRGVWLPAGTAATELELFYPISPDLGLLIGECKDASPRQLSIFELNSYNATMAVAAHEQVYAKTQADLSTVTQTRELRRLKT